jgi:hypothetical protein
MSKGRRGKEVDQTLLAANRPSPPRRRRGERSGSSAPLPLRIWEGDRDWGTEKRRSSANGLSGRGSSPSVGHHPHRPSPSDGHHELVLCFLPSSPHP